MFHGSWCSWIFCFPAQQESQEANHRIPSSRVSPIFIHISRTMHHAEPSRFSLFRQSLFRGYKEPSSASFSFVPPSKEAATPFRKPWPTLAEQVVLLCPSRHSMVQRIVEDALRASTLPSQASCCASVISRRPGLQMHPYFLGRNQMRRASCECQSCSEARYSLYIMLEYITP